MMFDENHDDINYRAVQLLTLSDRVQHNHEVIIPALKEGKIVICDRYIYTSIANMKARNYRNETWFYQAAKEIIKPDISFLAFVEPEIAISRIKAREEEKDREIEIKDDNLVVYKGVILKGNKKIKVQKKLAHFSKISSCAKHATRRPLYSVGTSDTSNISADTDFIKLGTKVIKIVLAGNPLNHVSKHVRRLRIITEHSSSRLIGNLLAREKVFRPILVSHNLVANSILAKTVRGPRLRNAHHKRILNSHLCHYGVSAVNLGKIRHKGRLKVAQPLSVKLSDSIGNK